MLTLSNERLPSSDAWRCAGSRVYQLQRNHKLPGDIHQPLDVVQHQGRFCSLSNRRLTALMMYQAMHRDWTVKAWCRICSSDTQKFEEANSTTNEGLGIQTRDGESQHFGSALFQRGEYALHELDQLVQRHSADIEFAKTISKIRPRALAHLIEAQWQKNMYSAK